MLEITFAEKEEEGGGAGGKMRTFSHTHSPIQSDSHTHQSRATHTLADSERLTHSSIQSRGVLNLVREEHGRDARNHISSRVGGYHAIW